MAHKDKEEKILSVLKENPHGVWIREISRQTGLDKSTISRTAERLHEKIEFSFMGRNKILKIRKE